MLAQWVLPDCCDPEHGRLNVDASASIASSKRNRSPILRVTLSCGLLFSVIGIL